MVVLIFGFLLAIMQLPVQAIRSGEYLIVLLIFTFLLIVAISP